MAIKTIRFRNNAAPTIADGANGMLLATLTTNGVYPQTVSGITAGWSPDNAALLADGIGIAGNARFGEGLATLAAGSADRRIRIDRPAGTFLVRMQAGLTQGGSAYATPRLRIIDSNGSTVLFAQTGGSINADGDAQPMQINTNGSKQTVGAADAGQTITTTGAFFFVEMTGDGTFQDRLSYIEWDDGAGGGTTTDLQLRITAGASVVTLAPLPLRVGGGGSVGTTYLAATWGNSTGTTVAAVRDGTIWDELYGQPTNFTQTMAVVTAGSTPAAFSRTPNALRITQRGSTLNGTVQKLNALPLNASYFGQLFLLNGGNTSIHNHPLTQNLIGGFQTIPIGLSADATNWYPFVRFANGSYPRIQYSPGAVGVAGISRLAHNTWYRYRWRVEIVTPGNGGTYRIYPQVYSYNNSTPTTLGTLLFDSSTFFQQDTTGAAGQSLQAFYDGGGTFGMIDATLARNVAFGQEGSAGATDTGAHWYIADLQLTSAGFPD